MLTPQYLAGLPDPIVELYSKAELAIIADMARRISRYDWTASVDWQYRRLREAGMMHDAIIERLASITGKTKKEIEGLISEAASKSLVADKAIYKAQGLTVPPLNQNKPMLEILQEGYKALTGALQNITKTTAQTATRQFEKALDDAWMQVQTGAFSADEAIRRAAGSLAEKGLQAITYKETGHIDTLEVAVRRAVVTGVNQTCGKVQVRLAEELGSDLMELTAHSGARPSHAKWQGKIVSLSGQPGYLSLADIGYGTGDGFKGWNCRHDWNPYFEGMPRTWTDEQLAKLEEKKFEYNGQKMTEYEAQQQQRYIERNIRRWKREKAAMEAAGQDTSKSDKKIREWSARQADFLEQTGLKRQYQREEVFPAPPPPEVPKIKRPSLDATGAITEETMRRDVEDFIAELEQREGKSKIENEVLELIKTTPVRFVDDPDAAFFRYDSKTGDFLCNPKARGGPDYDIRYVLSHECGHKLDYTKYDVMEQKEYLIGFFKSVNRVNVHSAEVEESFYSGGEFEDSFSVSALTAALTRGRIHGIMGHKPEYYAKYEFRMFREAFADLCALKVAAGEKRFLKKAEAWYFRDICVAFDQLIGG